MSTTIPCHYCGTRLQPGQRTRDHIVPQSIGGPDRLWNVVIACEPCNGSKADQWPQCVCPKCAAARREFRRQNPDRKITKSERDRRKAPAR